MKLNKLTGSLSWYIFGNIKIDAKFLKVPATSWNEDWKEETSNSHGRDIIKALKVCNDRAIREVKLVSDFLAMPALAKKIPKNI